MVSRIKAHGFARGQYEIRRKDGASLLVATHTSGFDTGGRLYLVVVGRHITEQTRAATALSQAEAKYRAILATMMDGFALLDASGRILEANDAYCRMVGYSPEEIVGMRVAQLDLTESQEEVARHIHHIQTRGWDRFETRHRHKGGTEVPLEISSSCSDRSRGLFVVFARDLTARKRLERQILEISDRE